MIKVNNLSYSFPEKDLYKNISFTLEEDVHCAFIGSNGNGKSTLIDLIMDPEKYMFDGSIEVSENCNIGYVNQFQESEKAKEVTVFEYIGEEFIKLQSEIDSICALMATESDIEPLLEKYQVALDDFEAIGGNDFESLINKKLNLANLISFKDTLISNLSGGQFKLIQVIKAMLNNPNLLIMDEPDVFLDFGNLNSLKDLINSHKGTILVITHNRYLLNHCFNKIIHLENKELQEFDGTYIDYNFSLLQTKIEIQELAHEDSEEIKRNEVLIEKYRKLATENAERFRGKTLQARVKIQERLEKRRIKAPFVEIKEPVINLSLNNEIEETLALKVKDLTLGFDEVLLDNVSFEVKSTDKVAIIGTNGTGKTTLLLEILKNNNPSIEINENVELGYLSQIQGTTLTATNTIADEFFEIGFKSYDDISDYLSSYGFKSDAIHQKIEALSGGERNILQLAKLSVSNSNMLLLDEPTSHLDTYSQIALEKSIKAYKGAVMMISHDFYTVVNCMDYVLIIEDKNIRRMSIKNFKKMTYENYFDKDYLEVERNKKLIEVQIEYALRDNDFLLAKELSESLEKLIKLM